MDTTWNVLSTVILVALMLWVASCAPAPAPPPHGNPEAALLRGVLLGPTGILFLLLVLILIAVIALTAWILRREIRPAAGYRGNRQLSRAEEIARERYARGEISREEYWQLIKDLEDSQRARPAQ